MKIPALPTSHLSYCTNIHPGESWHEVQASLHQYLPLVKKRLCADAPFGVGLRLSAQAAQQLLIDPEQLQLFKFWLQQQDLYVFTVNGFPYGTFHGQVIKENVYLPDWRSSERLEYSKQLAKILACLIPAGDSGSISTVPVGFKTNFLTEAEVDNARTMLLEFVVFAKELETTTGVHVALALEPEPACYLENTQGTLDFFTGKLYSQQALEILRNLNLPDPYCTVDTIKRYLGVCIDTCHAAVMFEDPLQMAMALRDAQISIPKIQLTAALKVNLQEKVNLQLLQSFAEGQYLHQSCVRDQDNGIKFYLDLPQALRTLTADNTSDYQSLSELRSHFHVPVFVDQLDGVQSTQENLKKFVQALPSENFSRHYEVETYTFDVLPEPLKKDRVEESISREIGWILETLA